MSDLYERQRRYYHLRAAEYDRSAWESRTEGHAAEVAKIVAAVSALPPASTLDVACGTGFLSQHLRGELTLLDASADMLAIAAERVTHARIVQAEALPLPFANASFERVFSSHFYDHLLPPEREVFLAQARRVGSELVLVQQIGRPKHEEGDEQRTLEDGTRHVIHKTYFTPGSLLAELGGGEILHEGRRVMVVRARGASVYSPARHR